MDDANELLGVLHGFYGLGGMLSPVLATALVTKAGWMWYQYYDIMSLLALIEIVFLVTAFWTSDGAHYRATHGVGEQRGVSDAEQALLEQDEDGHNTEHVPNSTPVPKHINNANANLSEVLKNKVTWIISLFLIAYVGVEVALGGWITTYMLRVRHGSPFAAGLATTGFWTGITVGRVVLGFVTPRYFPSIKEAVVAYLVGSIAFQMVFWLIPSFMAGAFSVFWLGFFIGPLFPAAVLAATGLLEARLHVSAIGFMAALGASGATIAPFLVGAIAEFAGSVKVLQPVVLICLLICLGFWCALPSLAKKK
ncbi:hypothetical protein KEM55_003572 [Ascosphaera atra]|nr:hypothetical protein KEM55_003572 [Ascosphaera atra]